MKAVRHAVALVALTGLVGRGQTPPPPTAAEADLPALQGAWQLVYSETDGRPAPPERIRGIRVVITDRTHTVYFQEDAVVKDVRFRLDATATPRRTDETLNVGPDAGKTIAGIYRIDGDTLHSCVAAPGGERPTSFDTAPEQQHTLRIFKRIRPDEDDTARRIREELTHFGGLWHYEQLELDGQAISAPALAKSRLKIQADTFTMTDANGTFRGQYAVDPTATPRTIDITFLDGPQAGQSIQGIYELEGDTYRACVGLVGKPRPTAFETAVGRGHVLQVLTRPKPKP